jgi:hypothetical protein
MNVKNSMKFSLYIVIFLNSKIMKRLSNFLCDVVQGSNPGVSEAETSGHSPVKPLLEGWFWSRIKANCEKEGPSMKLSPTVGPGLVQRDLCWCQHFAPGPS